MGAYTGTPTVNLSYEVGDRTGKRQRVLRNLTLVLSTQGGATNVIAATKLGIAAGFLYKADCVSFTDGSSQIRAVWLFTDGTNLYVGDPTQVTDANRGIPADVTGTLVCEVQGLPV